MYFGECPSEVLCSHTHTLHSCYLITCSYQQFNEFFPFSKNYKNYNNEELASSSCVKSNSMLKVTFTDMNHR